MDQFGYVDGFYKTPSGIFVHWRRFLVDEIDDRIRKVGNNIDCFCTIQRFKNVIPTDDEVYISDIYFDLDGDLNTGLLNSKSIILFFIKELKIPVTQLKWYFSGNKGYHLVINHKLFNINPSGDLSQILKIMSKELINELNLKTLDLNVYTRRRMFRLPNSLHSTSNLFKVKLPIKNLQLNDILNIAKSSNSYDNPFEFPDIESRNEVAINWWNNFVKQFDNHLVLKNLTPINPLHKIPKEKPVCVKFLESIDEIPIEGRGNKAIMALSSYYKDTEVDIDTTKKSLVDWACKLKNVSSAGNIKRTISKVESVVEAIYEKNYHFSCSFIRAVGGGDRPVPCIYRLCPVVKESDQTPKDPIKVSLSDASKAEYIKKPLSIDVLISGKDTAPFIIPKTVTIICGIKEKCEGCPFEHLKEPFELRLKYTDNILYDMIRNSNDKVKGIIRKHLRISKCKNHSIHIIDNMNIEEVRMVPQVNQDDLNKEYVVRKGFFVGHGLKINQRYSIKCFTIPDPKSQYALHIFEDYTVSSKNITSFEINPIIFEQLKIFQRDKLSVEEKINDIHNDLEANVTKIWDRKILTMGVDLIYHTTLNFKFQDVEINKGWGELLIIGDSGQGKSTVIEKISNHYQLGEIVLGESSKRTGLVYNLQENQGRWFLTWGVIPLNDGGLIVIDEFSGMDPEQFSEMSGLRSSGIAKCTKSVYAETNARTRLILSTNPMTGRPLSTYDYGVQAIFGSNELFPLGEDVRRFDLALGIMSGDISVDIINRNEFPIFAHKYTSSLCNLLLRWVWSRKSTEIMFEKEATDEILISAKSMSLKYSPDMYLVEPADQRMKIARLSIAVAARLFSCDISGKYLIIKKEHVQFAVQFMHECFHSIQYDSYSEIKMRHASHIMENKKEIIREFTSFKDWRPVRDILLSIKYFRREDLEEELGLNRFEAGEIIKFLARNYLIERTGRGFRKRSSFIKLLKEL